MIRLALAFFLFSFSATYAVDNHESTKHSSRFLLQASKIFNQGGDGGEDGTKWAVLIAGSKGWENYRHQADVCHAYQVLKEGGLKDENIVVMMYDDIAYNSQNPRPGVIINSPEGPDVYSGVPKDYTGEDVNEQNFYNVVLGNKAAIKGGSGKVVESGPNDHIFIYYTDHGGALVLSMPTGYIYAEDLNEVLKQKHDSGTYRSLVFYLQACEAGSMFDGLLSPNLNIYATTASNPSENSYACYCPNRNSASAPSELNTCLGDLYSIAWLEDCDYNSSAIETLQEQYQRVRERTTNSHVMQYGTISISEEKLFTYIGEQSTKQAYDDKSLSESLFSSVNQRDADLVHYREKFRRAPEGSKQKLEAKKQLIVAMNHRVNVDNNVKMIGELLFGSGKGLEVMKTVRPAGQAPVDDWNCFKALLHTYEAKCGALSPYGRKHTRVFANFCNAGIRQEQMEKASAQACSKKI